jgi:3-hydroxyisobutyrate dehydrogenase-like beta-hydroxyacid dehydrogenase
VAKVTVIGLGPMGSALARALMDAGHDVTVWNRSRDKIEPFVERGAAAFDSIADAVGANPFTVVCIDNYDSTRRLLGADVVAPLVRGRTIVQLSTGTPAEARDAEAWMHSLGARYLDGAIMAYPDRIGGDDTRILVAGAKAAYGDCRQLLECFGGDLRYLGENIASAATIDMALLARGLCHRIGAIHASLLCESEGVDIAVLASMFPGDVALGDIFERVEQGRFDDAGATITVWNAALTRIRSQATSAGIASDVPDFVASLFDRAIAAGYGEQDIAALVNILGNPSRR